MMFDQADHIGELAELYALGDLSVAERERVDRHARECLQCAQRLGEAEATLLQLIERDAASSVIPSGVEGPLRPSRFGSVGHSWATFAAIAAAFLIGLLPWGMQTLLRPSTPLGVTRTDDANRQAMSAMLAGHFVHAPLLPLSADAPAGKVIYAREGGWIYVIVAAGAVPLDIDVVSAGTRTRVASLEASAQTRAAFIRTPGAIQSVELLQGSAAIAQAKIVLPAKQR
jgi:hypothetical protein